MRKRAVALRYEQNQDKAPRVVAKGASEIAERIVALGEQAGIPVIPDEELVGALMALEIDSVIPQELYQAVAEVLAYVYRRARQ
jgi:flagellar biosynthesis protein